MQNIPETNRKEDNTPSHQIFKDEATNARIQKHLEDEEDVISEKDISNIKTEMSPATQEDFEEAAAKEGFSKSEIESLKSEED